MADHDVMDPIDGVAFEIGGDPDSIRAAANWIENKLTPAVMGLVRVVRSNSELDDDDLQFGVSFWSDSASRVFYKNVRDGLDEAKELVAKLDDLASLFRATADSLSNAQVKVGHGLAELSNTLVQVRDGVMEHPDITEMKYPSAMHQARNATGITYGDDVVAYSRAASMVERANGIVYERMKKLVEEITSTWKKIIIVSGWTSTATAVLAQHRLNKSTTPLPSLPDPEEGKLHRGRPYGSRILNTGRPSLVLNVAKRGGYLLAVAGTVYDLWRGVPPEKAVMTTVVSLAASSGATVLFLAVSGSAPGLGMLAAAAVVGTIAGAMAGEKYGEYFDQNHPKLAYEKMLE